MWRTGTFPFLVELKQVTNLVPNIWGMPSQGLLNQSWKCSFWTLLNVRDAWTTSPRTKLGVKLWLWNNWYWADSQMLNYIFENLFQQNLNCTQSEISILPNLFLFCLYCLSHLPCPFCFFLLLFLSLSFCLFCDFIFCFFFVFHSFILSVFLFFCLCHCIFLYTFSLYLLHFAQLLALRQK